MAFVLSERGAGSVREILRSPADLVLDAWAFAQYRIEYEATEADLNKQENKK